MLDEARASDTEGQHRATPRKLADERRRRSHEADAKLQQTRNNQSQCKSRLWSKPSQLQISYPPAVGMSQISYGGSGQEAFPLVPKPTGLARGWG